MISIPRFLETGKAPVIRLIGLGNAGVNLADRITMSHGALQAVAMNSDLQSLSSSVAPSKIALGPLATRGLGAGGDPEIGLDAARESSSEIEDAMAGADIIFLAVGLGGGTGSGAAGMVAEVAKEKGALLIALVTSPFSFEGRRRTQQARNALEEISRHADAVIHFENDRMSELTAPRTGVSETFAACDDLMSGCIASLLRILSASGPMAVGLPDLLAVLRGRDGSCLFGTGASAGDNRAFGALEQALRSPLLDKGRMLDEAGGLLVHVSGPPGLSLAEVNAVLDEVSRHVADASQMHLGISTQSDGSAPVVVTILGKCGSSPAVAPVAAPPTRSPQAVPKPPRVETTPELVVTQPTRATAPQEPATPPAEPAVERPKPEPPRVRQPSETAKPKQSAQKIRQETLQFEPVARGRFEKIEPTIVEGEDLDVPTFLRQTRRP